jgi:REP element-mobilizing transposase RayT
LYFVTICTHDRACLFGDVVDGHMRPNAFGEMVRAEWFLGAALRPYLQLLDGEFAVLPDHIHGILRIVGDVDAATTEPGEARHEATTAERFGKPLPGSVPTIVRAFKAATTRRVNEGRRTPGAAVWQRGYHDHVIRDDESLQRIRQYIADNPSRWAADRKTCR